MNAADSGAFSRRRRVHPSSSLPESADDKKRIRRHSRGHAFTQIAVSDNARAHLGDHYGDVHVHGDYHGPARPLAGEDDLHKALLDWLRFPKQNARKEQIRIAHRETFE